MKKKFYLFLYLVLFFNILIGCCFFSSNSSLLKKSVKKTNDLKKVQGSYNISLHRFKEKPQIILNSNFTFDQEKNKFLNKFYFNFGENGSNLNKILVTYIEDNQSYIKLPDCNKFIALNPIDLADSYIYGLKNYEHSLNNSMKNFKAFINNLLQEKNPSFESKKNFNYLNLTLDQNESKPLLNKLIYNNLNIIIDILVENTIDELNRNNTNLTEIEKTLNKRRLMKFSKNNNDSFLQNIDISKMKITLSIDKKNSLIKSYETSTKLSIDSDQFFLDIDYQLIEFGDKCKFTTVNTNNSISYKEFADTMYK